MLQFQQLKIKRQKDMLQRAHQDFQWSQKANLPMKDLDQVKNKKLVK